VIPKTFGVRLQGEISKMTFKTAQSARRSGPGQGPCHLAFMEARAEMKRRAAAPPSRTLHLLHRHLDDVEATLRAIAALVQGLQACAAGSLVGSCCTTDDKGVWLKGLPKVLASFLGQFPSSDGGAVAHLQDQAAALVADCDAAHLLLKPSIELEYRAMRRGESLVLPLVLRTRTLLQHVLADAVRTAGDEQSTRPGTTTSDFQRF
jgi:hypothetical protein